MSIPAPPIITTPPQPPLPTDSEAVFDAKAGPWLEWQSAVAPEYTDMGDYVYARAQEIEAQGQQSTDDVAAAAASASAAAGSAASAAASATDAAGSESAAAASASAAAGSAASAAASAASAADSETASASSAAASAASEAKAAQWADSPDEVEPGRYSAKHWADQASAAVAEGIIEDGAPRTDRAWSSQKTADEIAAAVEDIDLSDVPHLSGATFTGPVLFDQEYDNGNSGAAITIDWSRAHNQRVTLNANCTLTFIPPAGVFRGALKVAVGSPARSIIWPPGTRTFGGVALEAPAANGTAIYSVYWDGTIWWVAGGRF